MKIFKNNIKVILAFIIGGIVFSGATAIALSVVASDVAYDNTNSGSEATTMQGAIDDLYDKAANSGGELHTVTLGTATSYNIKNLYPDLWDKLTTSNFYYKVSSIAKTRNWVQTGAFSKNEAIHVYHTVTAPSLSYNTTTGVLTCGNQSITIGLDVKDPAYSFGDTTTCYMVYVD